MKTVKIAFPIPVFKNFNYLSGDNVYLLSRVRAPFGHSFRTGYVVKVVQADAKETENLKRIDRVIDPSPLITPPLLELARHMSSYYAVSLGEVLGIILPPFIKPFKKKEPIKEKTSSFKGSFNLPLPLKKVLKPIMDKRARGEKYLLTGPREREKEKIYSFLVSRAINEGESAILLAPEISVSNHLARVLSENLGGVKVYSWHSRISGGEKMRILQRLREGEEAVVVGTRSAIFSPVRKLGLIIVDEEQDEAYKEEKTLCYDARWVGEKRSEIEKARLILTSKTPSVKSYHRACEKEINLIQIPGGEKKKEVSEITLVDMKREKGWMFSRYLLNRIEERLSKGEKTVIFINRRGFSSSAVCRSCGESLKCPSCNINLSMHSNEKKLKCHICGYNIEPPKKCPSCQGGILTYKGFGTERAEKALNKIFPDARTLRMDADTAGRKRSFKRIYKKFSSGKIDILVGTSLITGGREFPESELVGVLDADTLLFFPDFRGAEKNYLRLRQISERAGLNGRGGEVVIQSFNPSHYSLKLQLDRDYKKFYLEEIKIRESMGFPPCRAVVNIICSHKNSARAEKTAFYVKEYIEKNIKESEVLGPAPAPSYKIRGSYRWQVLIKHGVRKKISNYLMKMKINRPVKAVKIKIDRDPASML